MLPRYLVSRLSAAHKRKSIKISGESNIINIILRGGGAVLLQKSLWSDVIWFSISVACHILTCQVESHKPVSAWDMKRSRTFRRGRFGVRLLRRRAITEIRYKI